jgi:hypothetical protein
VLTPEFKPFGRDKVIDRALNAIFVLAAPAVGCQMSSRHPTSAWATRLPGRRSPLHSCGRHRCRPSRNSAGSCGRRQPSTRAGSGPAERGKPPGMDQVKAGGGRAPQDLGREVALPHADLGAGRVPRRRLSRAARRDQRTRRGRPTQASERDRAPQREFCSSR